MLRLNNYNLDTPGDIIFTEPEHDDKTVKMTISNPCSNMQTDEAAFEGWALLMKCLVKYEKVVLTFDPVSIGWSGGFHNLVQPEQVHYMRFLFRLWRFAEIMDWFKIDDEVKDVVNGFAFKLNSIKTKANYPKSDSSVSEDKTKLEHHTEKLLVKDGGNYINKRLEANGCSLEIKTPHDQLPNGLFMDVIEERTRIFPTGFLDIWALSKDERQLCIFELKVASNMKVGIISELFFYAEYAKFVFLNDNIVPNDGRRFHIHRKEDSAYRGYYELQKALTNGIVESIRAIFFVEELHTRLAENIDNILSELNKTELIKYSVVKYDRTQLPE